MSVTIWGKRNVYVFVIPIHQTGPSVDSLFNTSRSYFVRRLRFGSGKSWCSTTVRNSHDDLNPLLFMFTALFVLLVFVKCPLSQRESLCRNRLGSKKFVSRQMFFWIRSTFHFFTTIVGDPSVHQLFCNCYE